MTFLDLLGEAAASTASAWHQFTLEHEGGTDSWYLFVEGRLDVSYYSSAVRKFSSSEAKIFTYICGGKRSVLDAEQKVRRSHPRCNRTLFFVDRDWCEYVGESVCEHEFLFQTEGYSIENDLVSVEALRVVWRELWQLPSQDLRLRQIEGRFEFAYARFHRSLLPVMAWGLLARQAGQEPNLNNIKMEQVVSFDDLIPGLVPQSFERIRTWTSCTYRPSLEDWLRTLRMLAVDDPKKVLRGKAELWFFAKFLGGVSDALRAGVRPFPQGSIQMTSSALASSLIGKLGLPKSLGKFLESIASVRHERACESSVLS